MVTLNSFRPIVIRLCNLLHFMLIPSRCEGFSEEESCRLGQSTMLRYVVVDMFV